MPARWGLCHLPPRLPAPPSPVTMQTVMPACVSLPLSAPPPYTHTPVTMRTVMPARWQTLTASGTSGRTGSLMPTMAKTTRLWSVFSGSSKKPSGLCWGGGGKQQQQ